MNKSSNSIDFQHAMYTELDRKLRATDWKSGASEAHGLLTGLACRSVSAEEIHNKMHLFQISQPAEALIFEGLFGIILADLESPEPTFNILLSNDRSNQKEVAEQLTDWCGGFLQGLYFDGNFITQRLTLEAFEITTDILEISNMEINTVGDTKKEDAHSLMEVEEYLRVSIQLIYDELVHIKTSSNTHSAENLH